MDEFFTWLVILFVVIVFLVCTGSLVKDSGCRDNLYLDAVHVRTRGWYCVGISESNEPFLVKYDEVINE